MQVIPGTAHIAEWIGPNYSGIAAFAASAAAMIVGSLLKPPEPEDATVVLPAATKGGDS